MRNLVFFDLETKRTSAEVGGRKNFQALGLAVAVTYSSASEEYSVYMEKDIDALIEELTSADLVVGFNLKRFDYEVLRGYRPLPPIPTLDILEDIYQELGFRVGLDALATSTLVVGKSAHGLQSIEWFREGRLDLVIDYCRQDVELTRLLYEYGRENGYLLYWDERLQMNRQIAVSWG
jgi:DEAD/DEAH box helicase domain-containing protein